MWLPMSLHFFTTTLLISLNFYSVYGVNDDSHSNTSGPYEKTKLRHSRHLRTPHGSSPENYGDEFTSYTYDGTNSKLESSNFTVADNHKPVFKDCSKYRPTVLEEEPADTFVFRVQASDKNPPDHGGTLTYDFVAADKTHIKFRINSKTGEIFTKTMLDRDEPNHEKEIYLTVKATDNGDPPLGDTCPIKIIVIDKNDNRPTFDKVSYEENVPQDLVPNSEVMRVSATDLDDGNNSAIIYSLKDSDALQDEYFYINNLTGIVYLKKKIDKPPGYKFKLKAFAVDQGDAPQPTDVDVVITVVESDKKAPYFISFPNEPIHLPENFTDYLHNITTFKAVSNSYEDSVVFSLGNNRVSLPFLLYSEKNTGFIRLAEQLDYEKVEKYDIAVRIQNKYKLAAVQVLTILVDDVNDNYPKFTEHISGSVLENEPEGTFVMQIRAVDLDRTPAFSKVTYELEDNKEFFDIDPQTGIITTKVKFDRETRDSYNVKVIAKDGAPSSRSTDGQPNIAEKTFSIEIADKNDHPPKFENHRYEATHVSENSNTNFLVIEVKASDPDSASNITYSIIDGNIDDAFSILPGSGIIQVKGKLDYETIPNYTLRVRAFDGIFQDWCDVYIELTNENDNPPVFENSELETTIVEESLPDRCLVVLKAYDPDIKDRNEPQNIVFIVEDSLDPPAREFFTINNEGCLSLIKPLDRDKPKGYEAWQVRIFAYDNGGPPSPPAMFQTVEIHIYLNDINDNAPFLNMSSKTVIWRENQEPGNITKLIGGDYDTAVNGPPFTFEMAPDADPEIRSKFEIKDSELHALVKFDREVKKEYSVPILITDSGKPPQSKVDHLTVIIGDENDIEMQTGNSTIFVYVFEGAAHDEVIGRVYVNDTDDWDLADKRFAWKNYNKYFSLDTFTGMITMSHGIPSQSYLLEFEVTEDPSTKYFARHSVTAFVNVTIKEIPEEAVDKSGSIRFEGITAEEFVTKNMNGKSKADILRSQLALALNNSEENIDVFTILHSPLYANTPHLDVRFSAHGSPYYYPERINSAIVDHQDEMERALGLRMLMINVNECLTEKLRCESSCTNELRKSNVSAAIYTNITSFIGINAYIDPVCECRPSKPQFCLNGGSVGPDGGCVCPDSYDGPNCEHTSIGFAGEGWALYPTFEACSDVHITMYVRAIQKDSLIFYVGPESVRPSAIGVEDFMSLELRRGYPVLLVNYGTGTTKIEHSYKSIVDDDFHKIEIILSTTSIEMIVDDCRLNKCLSLSTPLGTNKYLNVNGPLQIGGTYMDLMQVGLHRSWNHKPFGNGFIGCIKNFTFNEKIYNLGFPSLARNVDPGCVKSIAESITFRFDWTFLLAIIICLAVLTILLMAVAVHRRKVEDMYKDADDIRENIINYEDEGGGEGDMTAYDLNVLRLHNNYDPITDEKYNMNAMLPSAGMDEVPDICGFLDGKKHAVDNDPETLPFDDVRHYAYEGDGNTTGSLSSLASGTDEGDLNFDYLSNFGPRFRKLADMYGEDASDEDSDTYHNTASVSWC